MPSARSDGNADAVGAAWVASQVHPRKPSPWPCWLAVPALQIMENRPAPLFPFVPPGIAHRRFLRVVILPLFLFGNTGPLARLCSVSPTSRATPSARPLWRPSPWNHLSLIGSGIRAIAFPGPGPTRGPGPPAAAGWPHPGRPSPCCFATSPSPGATDRPWSNPDLANPPRGIYFRFPTGQSLSCSLAFPGALVSWPLF